jgi:Uma2 family endonuclease
MATAVLDAPKTMTLEEFLALPDDGTERMLLNGVLWEIGEGTGMTRRNRFHSSCESRITKILGSWIDTLPEPRPEVVGGEAGFVLSKSPDHSTSVGIDVAVISAELADSEVDDSWMYEGIPLLAVEILSPSDTIKEISAKLKTYRECGVPVVWIVDTDVRTVTEHRPDREPKLFTKSDTIAAEPHLPRFSCRVGEFFR